jgi:uncharacterized protein (TIGR02145 family)
MKTNAFKIAIVSLIIFLSFQIVVAINDKPVKDVDGNVYKTVTIGTQTWMSENLKTTKFSDGTPIPHVENTSEMRTLKSGAYSVYENKLGNSDVYGKLYNFYAVADPRNICPQSWHVPTDAEWQKLIDYLGGDNKAGGKMKEAGNTHWGVNNGGTNESGFSALPGGHRYPNNVGDDNSYNWIGVRTWFWSSTKSGNQGASRYRELQDIGTVVIRDQMGNECGFSVRCLKD